MDLAQAARQAHAVFAGQVQVDHQQVNHRLRAFVAKFFSTRQAEHPVAQCAEYFDDGLAKVVVVFDYDNVQMGSHNSNLTVEFSGR